MTTSRMTRNVRREFYGEVSKFFLDIAKLVFAGVILLAGILKEDVSVLWLLTGGALSMTVAFWGYYYYFRLSKK